MTGTFGSVLAAFEPPSTKDFVWDCWGPALRVGGLEFCMNFIYFLVLLGFLAMLGFFYFALRKPRVVPGKLQSTAEIGIQFVRENIALQMIGPEGDRYMPLLATLFFKYMPELVRDGRLYSAVPPLHRIELSNPKKGMDKYI